MSSLNFSLKSKVRYWLLSKIKIFDGYLYKIFCSVVVMQYIEVRNKMMISKSS